MQHSSTDAGLGEAEETGEQANLPGHSSGPVTPWPEPSQTLSSPTQTLSSPNPPRNNRHLSSAQTSVAHAQQQQQFGSLNAATQIRDQSTQNVTARRDPQQLDSGISDATSGVSENYGHLLENPIHPDGLQQRDNEPVPNIGSHQNLGWVPVEVAVLPDNLDAATFSMRAENRADITAAAAATIGTAFEPPAWEAEDLDDDEDLPPFNPVLTRQTGFYNEATSSRNLGLDLVDNVFLQ